MSVFGWIVAAWLVLDALRLRRNAAALPVLQPEAEGPADGVVIVAAAGVQVPDGTAAAAAAHMAEHGLDVLDLVPGRGRAADRMGLLALLDPNRITAPLARGVGACTAVALTPDVCERAGSPPAAPPTADELASNLLEWKRCAPRTTGAAVAPGLATAPVTLATRRRAFDTLVGVGAPAVVLFQGAFLGMLAWLVWSGGHTVPGVGAAALAFHLQPLVAMGGLPCAPRGLLLLALLRWPIEAVRWLGLVLGAEPALPDPVADLRPEWEALMAGGTDRFFGARRETCPSCGSAGLRRLLDAPDIFQHKPGRFRLDRCRDCRLVFQNPRLNGEGLDFYYRDFYDGLGEAELEFVFAAGSAPYQKRAEMVTGHAEPRRWLDAGGGHGHFCCVAREVWPDCSFEASDLSVSVEAAERRGWVDRGWRGALPDLAGELEGRFDVVSMSHVLEHAPEQAPEIEAAHRVLAPGGLLLAEVPDPDCPWGRILGRWWLPWFQPQHLNLAPLPVLTERIEAGGFEIVATHRREAALPVDLLYAAIVLVNRAAGQLDKPWLPPTTPARRRAHGAVWLVGLPVLAVAALLDRILFPLVSRIAPGNNMRVLARRVEGA